MKHQLLIIGIAACLAWNAGAAEPWTLEQAIRCALTNSPDARLAQQRIDVARAGLSQANAAFSPQVQFASSYSRSDNPMQAFGSILNQRAYAKITAPFDGVITAKGADVGDLATPGKPLLELEYPATLRLEADVPDALISKIKLKDKLLIRVTDQNPTVEGVVSEIAPAADPVSRTFRVKLDLPASSELRSGQFARVAVPVAQVNALRVPMGAVNVRGQMEVAFVVTNQHAQMRLVLKQANN